MIVRRANAGERRALPRQRGARMKQAVKQKSGLSIAETIRQGLGRLTPTERKPALVLLANYPVPGLEPVAQFAKRAGVSGPTVLRLVAKLGFSSYPLFQQALRDELELRLQPPLAKMPAQKARQGNRGRTRDPDFLNEYGR